MVVPFGPEHGRHLERGVRVVKAGAESWRCRRRRVTAYIREAGIMGLGVVRPSRRARVPDLPLAWAEGDVERCGPVGVGNASLPSRTLCLRLRFDEPPAVRDEDVNDAGLGGTVAVVPVVGRNRCDGLRPGDREQGVGRRHRAGLGNPIAVCIIENRGAGRRAGAADHRRPAYGDQAEKGRGQELSTMR